MIHVSCANTDLRPFLCILHRKTQPELCNAVFVARVEAANSRDMDMKLRSGVTELPPCAVCLGTCIP